MTTLIWNRSGQIIGRSKNLRGINERCRKVIAIRTEVVPAITGGASFLVKWLDGSWASTTFASYDVACRYQRARRFSQAQLICAPRITPL